MTDRTQPCQRTNSSPSAKSQTTSASPTEQRPGGSQKGASQQSASDPAPGASSNPSWTDSSSRISPRKSLSTSAKTGIAAAAALGAILIGGGYSIGSYAATSGPAAPEADVSTPAATGGSQTPQRDLSREVALNLGFPNLRAACNSGWGYMCFITRVEHTPPATMTVHATKGGSGLAEVLAKNAPAGIDTVVLIETGGDTYTEPAVAGEASA